MKLVDLSHTLESGMPSYPGLPVPQFHTWFTHGENASRGTYAPGTTFQIATYDIGGNTGTYIDAPFHCHPEGQDLAGLPLEKLANIPGIVVTQLKEGAIGPEAFTNIDVSGKAVLVRTDWSKHWKGDYFHSGPFLTAEACHYLVQAQVALVGIDCANIDDMNDATRPAHTVLLAAGIPIVEHLRGLNQLPTENFRFLQYHQQLKAVHRFQYEPLPFMNRQGDTYGSSTTKRQRAQSRYHIQHTCDKDHTSL